VKEKNLLQTCSTEWQVLQTQYDSYEKFSLIIKLVAFVLCFSALALELNRFISILLLTGLWLQDSIWKTFQGRIEHRLLDVEANIQGLNDGEELKLAAMQFNQEFLKQRSGVIGLVSEYFKQALRPTIAYPHVLLIAVTIFANWI
jgi:hypothetical protein